MARHRRRGNDERSKGKRVNGWPHPSAVSYTQTTRAKLLAAARALAEKKNY